MDVSLWFLVFEDIFFLAVVCAFLYLRQRPYTILATIILAITVVMNIVSFRGYHNWFIVVLPCLVFSIMLVLARPFLPRTRLALGIQTARMLLFLLSFLTLFVIVILVIAVVFSKK